LLYIAEALRRCYSIEEISSLTKLDLLFLDKILHIIEFESELKKHIKDLDCLKLAKQYGFSYNNIAQFLQMQENELREYLKSKYLLPVFKMVDSCAGEFRAATPYFYSTYEWENESKASEKQALIVLGSGPIRIGQGIEFDYATVHC